jgi:hypothetical protein
VLRVVVVVIGLLSHAVLQELGRAALLVWVAAALLRVGVEVISLLSQGSIHPEGVSRAAHL